METALLVLASITALGAAVTLVIFVRGARAIPILADQPVRRTGPLVSVIFAAKDEGPNIEAALGSMLAQSYERIEFIAVNDRSVDDTGAVLERMAARDPRIRVVHVTELPPKWLGKNHALHAGAALAAGEYLLFTDADIIFETDAIARAVPFLEAQGVDHLTLGPEMVSQSAMLELAVTFFTLGFFLMFRPWLVHDPKRQEHVGVGAFNLVRASRYHAFGGHSKIALRPDDDLKLGRMVKVSGGRQMVAAGIGIISVRWYGSVPELVRGLRKNTFAAVNYKLPLIGVILLMQLLGNIWPFIAVFVTEGPTRWLNLASALIFMAMYAAVAVGNRGRPWLAIGYPVAALIFMYILIDATWRTLRRGGIEWRGTFYSLADLRSNVV